MILQRGIALEEYVDCPQNVTCGDRKKVLLPGHCCPQCAKGKINILHGNELYRVIVFICRTYHYKLVPMVRMGQLF